MIKIIALVLLVLLFIGGGGVNLHVVRIDGGFKFLIKSEIKLLAKPALLKAGIKDIL